MARGQQYGEQAPASDGVARAARRAPARARWLFLIIALFLLVPLLGVLGVTVGLLGAREDAADPVPEAPAAVASAPPVAVAPAGGAPVRWLLSGGDADLYTVEVGAGGSGPLRVLEDATAVGTYAWSGSTLTIDFRRTLTMADGFTFEDPWTFVCTGGPEDATLTCVGTSSTWFYHADDGLDPGQPVDFDAVATRR